MRRTVPGVQGGTPGICRLQNLTLTPICTRRSVVPQSAQAGFDNMAEIVPAAALPIVVFGFLTRNGARNGRRRDPPHGPQRRGGAGLTGGRHESTPFTRVLRLKTLSPLVTYMSSMFGPPNSTFDSGPGWGAGMIA